jgi:hypothetical protein
MKQDDRGYRHPGPNEPPDSAPAGGEARGKKV